jgi:peptidoglycan/xylan/chitin deacetylase (PgdA/CDA1 family)
MSAARHTAMQAAMQAALLALVLPACRGRPAAPILTWHSIADAGDGFAVPPAQFAAQLDALKDRPAISLHRLLEGAPPARAIVLTFDDGAESAFTVALPELRKRGLLATFFIVTGLVADDEAHRRTQDGVRYLIWPEVLQLARAGMEIGSHSVDHARLPELSNDRVREELLQSKRALEEHLGAPVEVFAYPFNAVRGAVRDAVVAAGYRAAVAGEVHGSDDPFKLYRVSVQRGTTAADLLAALSRWPR